jgi:hypothetical protein
MDYLKRKGFKTCGDNPHLTSPKREELKPKYTK